LYSGSANQRLIEADTLGTQHLPIDYYEESKCALYYTALTVWNDLTVEMRRRKRHARDALFVKSHVL